MSETAPKRRWGSGVRIGQPRLAEQHFQWDGNDESAFPSPLKFEYTLTLRRFGELELGVEFGVSVVEVQGLVASATYRAVFQLDPESPEGEEPDKDLRLVAVRLAPGTLYPFCREAIVSAAQRSGLLHFVPPITNVGLLWEPHEIELPSAGPAEQESDGVAS